jgi:Flp pilus assembly pilin Flp
VKATGKAAPPDRRRRNSEATDMLKALTRDDGQDLLEYGLLASLIATFVVGALTMVGHQVNDVLWGVITQGLRF